MITQVYAEDADLVSHSDIKYKLMDDSKCFTIDMDSGEVSVRCQLRQRIHDVFNFTVEAMDRDNHSTNCSVQIIVTNTIPYPIMEYNFAVITVIFCSSVIVILLLASIIMVWSKERHLLRRLKEENRSHEMILLDGMLGDGIPDQTKQVRKDYFCFRTLLSY